MKLNKEIQDLFENFISYFKYHNKNLNVCQTEIINEISEIFDILCYENNGNLISISEDFKNNKIKEQEGKKI